MIKAVRRRFLLHNLMILFTLYTVNVFAEEEQTELEYLSIEPVIITNYLKVRARKPGFVQMRAQLTVRGKQSIVLTLLHMPLIRDYLIEYLSFIHEKDIKDVSKRNQLRKAMASGIQQLLSENTGTPLIEDLVITHFIWN